MSNLRVVVDTSVIISAALLPRSTPADVLRRVLNDGILLVSEGTIAELSEVLRRPKFDRYVSEGERLELLAALLHAAELVVPIVTISICRDPKDNQFLELAVSGHATHLITGDDDLLILNPFEGIEVINPLEFLSRISHSDQSDMP